jgi:hypothetical protein
MLSPTVDERKALVDGQCVQDTLRMGRAAIHHVRTKGPAILQVSASLKPPARDIPSYQLAPTFTLTS